MDDVEKLSAEKVSGLVTSNTSAFKDKLSDMELSVDSLKELKKAEAAGQNRSEILGFVDSKINAVNVAAHLGTAKEDVAELEEVIEFIEEVEHIEHFEQSSIEIDQDTLIDLVGGTVKELKKFVGENTLTVEQLNDILKAESKVKNRKTAKSFLKSELRKRKVAEDAINVKQDIDNLKDDLEELEDDTDTSDIEISSEAQERPKTSTKNKSEDESDNIEDTQEDEAKNSAKNEDESEEDEESVEKQVKSEDKKEDQAEKTEEESEPEENETGDNEEDSEDAELKEKRKIADELGLDITDNDLKKFSAEDLRNVLGEKKHREDLIDLLVDQGLDKSALKASSTEDLEKIAESFENDDNKEDHQEMREEAEEDLEMLMGAVRRDDEDDESEEDKKSAREKLEDFKQSIKSKISKRHSAENSSNGIDPDQVSEVLDQYRNLSDEEAAVKTAHVMKGFLEQNLGIRREMTYKELAENMPIEEDENIESLAEFFLKMHQEQYTGKFKIKDADSTIDTCEDVLESLS